MVMVQAMGLADKISGYSYQKYGTAYLEEDCDATLFLDKAKELGWTVQTVEKYSDTDSFVRSLESYRPLDPPYSYSPAIMRKRDRDRCGGLLDQEGAA